MPKTSLEVYYRNAAILYKEKITIPLILVGGIRSFEIARELIENELTDYISLSHPLIRKPGLIKRWQSGDIKRLHVSPAINASNRPQKEKICIVCWRKASKKEIQVYPV